MRSDMKKVIIERPRVGGGAYRKPAKRPYLSHDIDDGYDSGPRKVSLTKEIGSDGKEQTDVLGPLKRYLHKQVGRPWNDVWSDICRHNKDFMGDHVKLHVGVYVEEHVYRGKDGCIYDVRGFKVYKDDLYVDPDTGILCIEKREESHRWRAPKNIDKIYYIGKQAYHKHNDIWFRVTVVKWEGKEGESCNDVFGHGASYLWHRPWGATQYRVRQNLLQAYGSWIYCTSKASANSKECKKLKKMEEERQVQQKQAA